MRLAPAGRRHPMTPAVGLDQAPIPPPSYHRTMAAALHVDACPNAGAALGVAGAMSRGRPPGPRAVPTATACWVGRCAAGLSRGVAVAPGAAAYVVALVLPWTGPCSRPGAPFAAFPPAGARAPWTALRKNSINLPIDRAESGMPSTEAYNRTEERVTHRCQSPSEL